MKIFHQKEIKRDFSFWLLHTLKALSSVERDTIGCNPSDIGTHSIRKGVATYVSSLPGTATMVSLFLRMGWSLGNVASRYLFEGEGGQDQLIGRIATLIPCDVRMSLLPPHFKSEDCLTKDVLMDIIPYYFQYPMSFRKCVPYLLASVIYHQDDLRDMYPAEHPLFSSRLFINGHALKLRDEVTQQAMHCKHSGMTATGVPTHVVSAQAIEYLQSSIEALSKEQSTSLQQLQDVMPQLVAQEVLRNCDVHGAVGVTTSQLMGVENSIKEHLSTLLKEIRFDPNAAPICSSPMQNGVYPTYCWGGRLGRRLPADFTFPRCSIKIMWDLWFQGNIAEMYPPFCKLEDQDIKSKTDKGRLRKARGVIAYILTRAAGMGEISTTEYLMSCRHVMQLAVTERDGLFHRVFAPIAEELQWKPSHHYTSLYNTLCVVRAILSNNNGL